MNNTASALHLRPHHLLCLQTFVGRGYSKEFVEHMTIVKRQLSTDPCTPIILVNGADDLCAHCPNCVEEQCTSEKPALFERSVMEKLVPLQSGQDPLPVLEGIPEALRITEDLLASCCPGCDWRKLCSSILSHKAFL